MLTPLLLIQLLAAIYLLVMKHRIERSLPKLGTNPPSGHESVSAIVPARNEENEIEGCIQSLLSQQGVDVEIIVVDDGSADRTPEIVKKYAGYGVKLVEATPPPEGWVGKTWACHLGYEKSGGEWLLFTDSDARMAPNLLSSAISMAREKGLDMLSLYPRFRMETIALKIILPILLLGLYLIGRPDKVNRGGGAFAFGSFILLRRSSYEAFGGHKTVKNAILEDRALARVAWKNGLKIAMADARGLMTAAWNKNFKTLWYGMARIFTPIFLGHKWKPLLFLTAIAYMFLVPVAGILYSLFIDSSPLIFSISSYIAVSIATGLESLSHRNRLAGFLLWPLGILPILASIFLSWYRSIRDPVIVWRGRLYSLKYGDLHELAEITY
ncbi:4,4'-diaponeurosporenoate glycosyltransferase [archaeon HR01]|nr:4,4'-diaponeurosporenoate glycosyltransferase [archaeon HR01]